MQVARAHGLADRQICVSILSSPLTYKWRHFLQERRHFSLRSRARRGVLCKNPRSVDDAADQKHAPSLPFRYSVPGPRPSSFCLPRPWRPAHQDIQPGQIWTKPCDKLIVQLGCTIRLLRGFCTTFYHVNARPWPRDNSILRQRARVNQM